MCSSGPGEKQEAIQTEHGREDRPQRRQVKRKRKAGQENRKLANMELKSERRQPEDIIEKEKEGHLGGSAVERWPLAQGVILGSWD